MCNKMIKFSINRKKHIDELKFCFLCGSESFKVTKYINTPDANDLKRFKDINKCDCFDCGFKHIFQDRKGKKNGEN